MAHELLNATDMIFTGAKPWHGLGVHFNAPPSIDEIKCHESLNWQVLTEGVQLADGTPLPASAIVRSDTRTILGVVGPQWTPLQNADAIEWFRPFVDSGVATIETAGCLFGGKKVWVLAKCANKAEVVPGDPVESYILLSNAHDGTMSLALGFTPVRVVCNNTLRAAHGHRDSRLLSLRHTKGIHAAMDVVRSTMDTVQQTFEATIEQYRVLANATCSQTNLEKLVKLVFAPRKMRQIRDEAVEAAGLPEGLEEFVRADPTASEDVAKRVIAQVVPLFDTGRGNTMKGVRGTMWAAYNAVTEFISHERGNSDETRLDSQWFGSGAALNQRALDAAVQMSVAA